MIKREHVVLLISLLLCAMVIWIIYGEEEAKYTIAPSVELEASVGMLARHEYENVLHGNPEAVYNDYRFLEISLDGYGVDGYNGEFLFVEPYKLEQLLWNEDQGRSGVYQSGYGMKQREDSIMGVYSASIDISVLEEPLMERIGDYPIGYKVTALDGTVMEKWTTLGEIVYDVDTSQLAGPEIDVLVELVEVDQRQLEGARSVFGDDSLEAQDVRKIKVQLVGKNLYGLAERSIDFLGYNDQISENELIYWYSNHEGNNDPEKDNAFYSQEGLVNVQYLQQEDIYRLFDQYVIDYWLAEDDGTTISDFKTLGDYLFEQNRMEGQG